MNISISTGLYYKKNYIEILDLIKKTGAKSIELFLNQAFEGVSTEEIKKAINERGLSVASIHTPLEFIAFPKRESEEYWINKSCEMARALEAKLIVTHMVLGEYFEELSQGLDNIHKENLNKYCNKSYIIITTENIPNYTGNKFLGDMDEFKQYIKKNNIPITFDVTHCGASNLPLIETFDEVKEFVKNIHLSDFGNGNEHKLLGDGELNIKEFLEYLVKEIYQGTITLELDFENKSRNDINSLEDAEKRLRESYLYINNIINLRYENDI